MPLILINAHEHRFSHYIIDFPRMLCCNIVMRQPMSLVYLRAAPIISPFLLVLLATLVVRSIFSPFAVMCTIIFLPVFIAIFRTAFRILPPVVTCVKFI